MPTHMMSDINLLMRVLLWLSRSKLMTKSENPEATNDEMREKVRATILDEVAAMAFSYRKIELRIVLRYFVLLLEKRFRLKAACIKSYKFDIFQYRSEPLLWS